MNFNLKERPKKDYPIGKKKFDACEDHEYDLFVKVEDFIPSPKKTVPDEVVNSGSAVDRIPPSMKKRWSCILIGVDFNNW